MQARQVPAALAALVQQRGGQQAAEPGRVLQRRDGVPGLRGDRGRQRRRQRAGLLDHGAPVAEPCVLVPVGIVDQRIPLPGGGGSRRRASAPPWRFAASTAAKAAASRGSVSTTPNGASLSASASSSSAASSPTSSRSFFRSLVRRPPFLPTRPARRGRAGRQARWPTAPSRVFPRRCGGGCAARHGRG